MLNLLPVGTNWCYFFPVINICSVAQKKSVKANSGKATKMSSVILYSLSIKGQIFQPYLSQYWLSLRRRNHLWVSQIHPAAHAAQGLILLAPWKVEGWMHSSKGNTVFSNKMIVIYFQRHTHRLTQEHNYSQFLFVHFFSLKRRRNHKYLWRVQLFIWCEDLKIWFHHVQGNGHMVPSFSYILPLY